MYLQSFGEFFNIIGFVATCSWGKEYGKFSSFGFQVKLPYKLKYKYNNFVLRNIYYNFPYNI